MASDQAEVALRVADLNKYGQALNNCRSVEEVVSLSLEAVSLLFEFREAAFVEVRHDELRVVHSTTPELAAGDEPGPVAFEAYRTGETTVRQGSEGDAGSGSDQGLTLAVPATIASDVVAIIVARSPAESSVDEGVRTALEILATHSATAIGNVRSRERLERAHRDLEKRKEMVEMYDRLLRHDLGNDLQVIAGFADEIARNVDDEHAEYANRIQRKASRSADLVRRVGDLVSRLDRRDEATPASLSAVLDEAVRDARDRYDSLTVDYDPDAFDERIYAGELLDSVFTNVLTNAAVHNEGPVRVRLRRCSDDGDRVVVSVADDGRGVTPNVADRLFEMGVKSGDSDGSGFGLGFAKALLESYGGDIEVRESDLGGADFRISLDRV